MGARLDGGGGEGWWWWSIRDQLFRQHVFVSLGCDEKGTVNRALEEERGGVWKAMGTNIGGGVFNHDSKEREREKEP